MESSKQIERLAAKQEAVKLLTPVIMALLTVLFCIPLLNRKMNLVLPVSLHNILLKLAGGFGVCFIVFYICYFGMISVMRKRYIKTSAGKLYFCPDI